MSEMYCHVCRKLHKNGICKAACVNCKGPNGTSNCKICRRCRKCNCLCVRCSICNKKINRMGVKRYIKGSKQCGHCSEMRDTFVCTKHCACRNRQARIANVPTYGLHARRETSINLKLLNTLNRPIGFEVEIGDWGMLKRSTAVTIGYTVAHDSSVYPSGQEMRVPPSVCDNLVKVVIQLGDAFEKAGCIVNETCGFHVHVDGGDYSYWDVRRLLTLWVALEEDCFNYLISPTRARNLEKMNRYYKPCRSNIRNWLSSMWGLPKGCLIPRISDLNVNTPHGGIILNNKLPKPHVESGKFCKTCALKALKESIRNCVNSNTRHPRTGDRYTALNTVSWFLRGTFEFRLKEGLLDKEEMLFWLLFCGWVVEAGSVLKDDVVKSIHNLEDFANLKINNKYFLPHDALDVRGWVLNKMRGAQNQCAE